MFHRHSSIVDRIRQPQRTSLFWNKFFNLGPFYCPEILDYTIKPMSTVCSSNTLGGKPLISRSANTCLLPFMLQAFLHNSGLSPLQRITLCQCVWHQHLTRCHRSKKLKMVIVVVNHYQFRVQVSLTILPVPQPHIMLYIIFTSY